MANTASQSIDVTEENGFCAGHFPGHPIVPAAAQTQWIIDLATEHSAQQSSCIQRLKLHRELRPGRTVVVAIEFAEDRWRGSVGDADGLYAELTLEPHA